MAERIVEQFLSGVKISDTAHVTTFTNHPGGRVIVISTRHGIVPAVSVAREVADLLANVRQGTQLLPDAYNLPHTVWVPDLVALSR